MNSVETAIRQGTKEPSPKWRERLKALRSNTPPIVRMVWDKGSESRGDKPVGKIGCRSDPARYVGRN